MNAEELKYYRHPKMQEKFREAMGPIRYADYVFDGVQVFFYDDDEKEYNSVLPLPIDRDNPERGLWGMVAGNLGLSFGKDGKSLCTVEVKGGVTIYHGETPTLALLKALAYQWRIEL